MAYITTPKEARNLVKDVIESNKVNLGIGYIGVDDEKRLPRYPAVVVSAGPKVKTLHATHTFEMILSTYIWVYHAKLTESHRSRSDSDLDLADAIESLLEVDLTFDESVVDGWVSSQQPGVFQPRSQKGDLVIGTRLIWSCRSQERF